MQSRGRHLSIPTTRKPNLTLPNPYLYKKLQWDKVENKTGVIVYASGAFVAIWLSSTVVGALNGVPLLPKLFELVGLAYSAWFTYRYLLFKSSREELLTDIEQLKKKISGDL